MSHLRGLIGHFGYESQWRIQREGGKGGGGAPLELALAIFPIATFSDIQPITARLLIAYAHSCNKR